MALHVIVQKGNAGADAPIFLRVCHLESLSDGFHLGLRHFERDPWFQTCERIQGV
jgi:hypothetical protein